MDELELGEADVVVVVVDATRARAVVVDEAIEREEVVVRREDEVVDCETTRA